MASLCNYYRFEFLYGVLFKYLDMDFYSKSYFYLRRFFMKQMLMLFFLLCSIFSSSSLYAEFDLRSAKEQDPLCNYDENNELDGPKWHFTLMTSSVVFPVFTLIGLNVVDRFSAINDQLEKLLGAMLFGSIGSMISVPIFTDSCREAHEKFYF